MNITYAQYRECSFLYPFVLIEWLDKVQTKIPDQSKYWDLEFQNKYFETAFNYVFVNAGKFYVGGYTNVEGTDQCFIDVVTFMSAQKAFSPTYSKRMEDWANLLKKGSENAYTNWEAVRYKWKA